MTEQRHLRVYGIPKPQGSKQRMPNGAIIEAGTRQSRDDFAAWRSQIAHTAAQHALEHGYIDWPAIAITVQFRFPMPASRPASVRRIGHQFKTSAPDLDKLIRTLGDGLQSTLFATDARICIWNAWKVEIADDWTGADIWLQPAHTDQVTR